MLRLRRRRSRRRRRRDFTQATVRAFLFLRGPLQTRPDIAYAVGMLCRCMSCPSSELLEAARRVLYYLESTASLGLTYSADQAQLYGMSDSDWATKHSTTGWVFMYNQACVTWNSSKQSSVALSSCEAEIMAASDAGKEAKFLRNFLSELGLGDPSPTALHVDNQAARDLAYNPEHHKRTKHIDRRHFFVRELVEDKVLEVPFVRTADNIADFFTKWFNANDFVALRDYIMNVP